MLAILLGGNGTVVVMSMTAAMQVRQMDSQLARLLTVNSQRVY